MFLNKFLYISLIVLTVALLGYASWLISSHINGGDFNVFYCAGKIIWNSNLPNRMVYDINSILSCTTPDFGGKTHGQKAFFIYSIPAAYILSPLALLPYLQAKALLITIELLSYATSIALLVNSRDKKEHTVPEGIFFLVNLWFPLFVDVTFGQINAILLLLITSATLVSRKRPFLAGLFLGIASFFKLFPIVIALFLGLKNWRIATIALLMLIIGAGITGWVDWFTAIGNMTKIGATPVYKLFANKNIYWFIAYVIVIYGVAIISMLKNRLDEFHVTTLVIAALFITMPIVEYYHLVLLIVPIIYLALRINENHWLINLTIGLAVFLISFCKLYEIDIQQNMMYAGCFILWLILQCDLLIKYRFKFSKKNN
jgi:hypothetical protein